MQSATDHHFYEQCVQPHYANLIRWVHTITGDQEFTEDIVQETMTTAWKNVRQLRGYRCVVSALRVIARRALASYHRQKSSREQAVEDIALESICDCRLSRSGSPAGNIAELYLAKEEQLRIKIELCRLRPEYRSVLIMHYYYDLSLTEIAALLNKKYNTVVSWHKRALAKLGKQLKSRE
ncbi:MAG TPA: RNA polymerase sigma factor [Clostridiales bacterium]|jgi:RNA polymerase sigma-70 factor (ECF subfamily)|nr:RNA polymerase sigma factor [Clostridiales bacterium]